MRLDSTAQMSTRKGHSVKAVSIPWTEFLGRTATMRFSRTIQTAFKD